MLRSAEFALTTWHRPWLQMRRLNSTTLQFDDIKSTATKDLELSAFNAVDKCAICFAPRAWFPHDTRARPQADAE
jgi:hypothetical protein